MPRSKKAISSKKATFTKKATSTKNKVSSSKSESSKIFLNKIETDFSNISFESSVVSKIDDVRSNMKVVSMNVAGMKGFVKKCGHEYFVHENADIICIQETKCSDINFPILDELNSLYPYFFHCSSEKQGYAGVSIFSRFKPLNVLKGLSISEHDKEGRVLTAEFDHFFLICVYVPNAGENLVRLDYRLKWDKDFRKFIQDLQQSKDVIIAGDMNCAHKAIDLKNPKTNERSAGFTIEERQSFDELLNLGFTDSFRYLNPELIDQYTYWSYRSNSRSRNVGWRLDYFLLPLSSNFKAIHLCDCQIRSQVFGSDHCPLVVYIKV